MALDIPSGQMSHSPTDTLPLDGSLSPAVAGVTPVSGLMTPADQTPARDLADERLSQLAGFEQDIAAAQHAGMSAENDRRGHYHQDVLPQGSSYGDDLPLPPVPAFDTPPPGSDLYPYPGSLPTPANAGLDFYTGDLPD